MKAKYFFAAIISILLFGATSCSSVQSGTIGGIAQYDPNNIINSSSNIGLNIDKKGITYNIDISTPDGILKLKDLSLKQAQNLALQEAVVENNAVALISPKITYMKKGGDVLRITVFGFPATYINKD